MTYLYCGMPDIVDWAKNKWQHEKKKGQALVRLKKNMEEGVLLLTGSFVVSLLTIKQGKVGCEVGAR